MEASTTPARPSRHIDSALDLMDEVLDNPYWSSFDSERPEPKPKAAR